MVARRERGDELAREAAESTIVPPTGRVDADMQSGWAAVHRRNLPCAV
jgi:hypothetical protein